jgi:hypothetical protein
MKKDSNKEPKTLHTYRCMSWGNPWGDVYVKAYNAREAMAKADAMMHPMHGCCGVELVK